MRMRLMLVAVLVALAAPVIAQVRREQLPYRVYAAYAQHFTWFMDRALAADEPTVTPRGPWIWSKGPTAEEYLELRANAAQAGQVYSVLTVPGLPKYVVEVYDAHRAVELWVTTSKPRITASGRWNWVSVPSGQVARVLMYHSGRPPQVSRNYLPFRVLAERRLYVWQVDDRRVRAHLAYWSNPCRRSSCQVIVGEES